MALNYKCRRKAKLDGQTSLDKENETCKTINGGQVRPGQKDPQIDEPKPKTVSQGEAPHAVTAVPNDTTNFKKSMKGYHALIPLSQQLMNESGEDSAVKGTRAFATINFNSLPPELPEDPILNRLRGRKLPIIWIVGEPTHRIKKIVTSFCRELADTFAFKHVNLDAKIATWYEREQLESPGRVWQNVTKNPKLPFELLPPREGTKVKVRAKLTDSLQKLVISYDRKALNYLKSVPNVSPMDILDVEKTNEISVDTREALSRAKILQLIKFAMIEEMTNFVRGFVLEASFYDRIDFHKFRQLLYPPVMGIYFTESIVNEEMSSLANSLQEQSPRITKALAAETDRMIKTKVKLELPRNYRRLKEYSFSEVDQLCNEFKDRVIRIVNAEHLNSSTIQYILTLVKARLSHHSGITNVKKLHNPLLKGKIPQPELSLSLSDTKNETAKSSHDETPAEVSGEHSSDHPSIAVSNAESSERRHKMLLELQFNDVKSLKLPLVWIYGYSHSAIAEQRKNCCKFLAKYFDFTFIQMDEQILRWHRYHIDVKGDPDDLHDFICYKAKQIIKKVMPSLNKTKEHYLTKEECYELIKFAMLHAMPTNGFILDNFPFSRADGREFERKIYPAAVGIYFCCRQRTKSKKTEPKVVRPKYFLRGAYYSENSVDAICSEFQHKTIKVINVEDLKETEMEAICKMAAKYLIRYIDGESPTSQTPALHAGDKRHDTEKKPRDAFVQPERIVFKHTSLPTNLRVESFVPCPPNTICPHRIPHFHHRPASPTHHGRRTDHSGDKSKTSRVSVGVNVDTITDKLKKTLTETMTSPIQSQLLEHASVVSLYVRPPTGSPISEVHVGVDPEEFRNPFHFLINPGLNFQAMEYYVRHHESPSVRQMSPDTPPLDLSLIGDDLDEYNPDDFFLQSFSPQEGDVDKVYSDDYRPVVDGIAPIPKVSMPSTVYETADSSEDEFDDSEDFSDENPSRLVENHSSKASTMEGLIFGAAGRRSKGGLLSPNTAVAIETSGLGMRLRHHEQGPTGVNTEDGNVKRRSILTSILKVFRRSRQVP